MYMKNEENFVGNLVAPAPKLFDNEIVRCRNGPQGNWRRRSCIAEKSCSLDQGDSKVTFLVFERACCTIKGHSERMQLASFQQFIDIFFTNDKFAI